MGATPRTSELPDLDPAGEASGSVVVGIDGSACSEHALRWALNKAGSLGSVIPVAVYQPRSTFDLITRKHPEADREVDRAEARSCLDEVLATTAPRLNDRARVIEAHPGLGLVEAAAAGDLLVVGTRGRGGVTAALLGSVSTYCVTNATVPVAVIPPDGPADEPLSTIVVGVDGSRNADAALRWAIDHVEADGTVLAVGAGSVYGFMAGEFDPPAELVGQRVRQLVEQAVERVGGPVGDRPRIIVRVDHNDARVALPRVAAEVDADLLVLGARGTTGVPYLILGSVSTALAHHPVRPTVIVPGGEETEEV